MHREQRPRRRHLVLIAALAVAVPELAAAYNFKPTPAEWAMWPEFCKARYVTTSVGRNSPYYGTVPAATIENWKRRIGNVSYTHVHHYCASLVYMQRSSSAASKQDRNYLLKLAEGDCNYTLKRIPTTSPIYRDVLGQCNYARSVRGSAGTLSK